MKIFNFMQFLRSESGAITVDWVVLTAAVSGMAIAATTVVEGGLDNLASTLEAELRTQQVSDAFVTFDSSHFDELYDLGLTTEEQAEDFFDLANEMTNAELLDALEQGILDYNDNLLSDAEVAELVAIASVAVQRNIIDSGSVGMVATY